MTVEHRPPTTPQETVQTRPPFMELLKGQWRRGNFVCAGIDLNYSLIPDDYKKGYNRGIVVREYGERIIEAVAGNVCAIKPNIAFYEPDPSLEEALQELVSFTHANFPDVPVIGDVKRGDIGNTNRGYVISSFDRYGFDAVTVSPYLGSSYYKETEDGERKLELDALKPFLEKADKGVIVLDRTSNDSAGEFQDLPIALNALTPEYKEKFGDLDELRDILKSDIAPLYQVVAFAVSRRWNGNHNVGFVTGATYPEEIAAVRTIVGDEFPFLIPGIGQQGGSLEKSVRAGLNSKKEGIIVNSSRGLTFAEREGNETPAQAAKRETLRLKHGINEAREAA